MKARFKTSGRQAQMKQAAEFKMVPLDEYRKLNETITHQRNQIGELASRFVVMWWGMVFNSTFNNISVLSWQSVLLVKETKVPRKHHRSVASNWQTLSHKCCTEYTSPWTRIGLATLVVIGTDCIGSCKSNYHMITTTMAPVIFWSIYGNKFFDTIIHLNYINFQKKILKGILLTLVIFLVPDIFLQGVHTKHKLTLVIKF